MAPRVDRLVRRGHARGAALVLYRQLPKIKRYLAYLPEGPVIDWTPRHLDDWLRPMLAHLKPAGRLRACGWARPWSTRRWTRRRDQGRHRGRPGCAAPRDVPPADASRATAPSQSPTGCGSWAGAPRGRRGRLRRRPAAVRLPGAARRTAPLDDVLKGIEPAVAAQHQEGREGGRRGRPGRRRRPERSCRSSGSSTTITAERDHFTPRPLSYFQRMFAALLTPRTPTGSALPRPARGRPGRRHDPGPGRRAHLVLLRRLLHREARGARLQRRCSGG